MDQEQSTPSAEVSETASALPLYFSVSPLKLVIMSTCTLGIYEIYWFYRNWGYVKKKEPEIMPFWRAIFSVLFCYPLFKQIRATAGQQGRQSDLAAGPLATGWILLTVVYKLPDPFWLITFCAVFFLIPVQVTINEINLANNPQHDLNRRFTGWNIAAVLLGGACFLLALVGTFFPAQQ